MPIPHQVTNEFFIPSDDLALLENEITTNPESARQRLNDLLFLFSLIDSAFDRDNGEDNMSIPQENDFINEPLEPDNFDSIADNLSENDDHDQSEENSENTSPSNKITEPDEELSEDNFDDVVDLFDDPSSSEQLPENIEHTGNHSNLNEFELNNLFNVLQRLRNQQRINEQNQMNEYDDW